MAHKDLKQSAFLPFGALALLALIWGYNWVVMKVGVRYSDPFTFAALRNFLGAIALFAVVAARRGSLRPQAFWLTALFGFFQTTLSGLAVWALYVGSAGRTSVLVYTMPFWLLLIAWPILGERIRGVQWVAVVLALAGLVFVLDPWGLQGLSASILAVAAGLTWAMASVLFKIIRKHHEVELLSFTAWQALLGSIPLIVVALLTAPEGPDLERELRRGSSLQRDRGQCACLAAMAVCPAQPVCRHGGHQQPRRPRRRRHSGVGATRGAAGGAGGGGHGTDTWRRWPS